MPPKTLSFAHPLSLTQADSVASDRCRPARTGRLGRRQQLDARIAQGGLDQWRVRAFAEDARSDGFEKGRSGRRHAAADDDALDARGQGERSDGSGQVVGHSAGDLERDLVAGRSGAKDISGTRMARQDGIPTGGDRLVGLAGDPGTGGDRFEAAAQTARAHDAFRISDGMAYLAGKAVVAAEHGAVEDDAGRDPGPD